MCNAGRSQWAVRMMSSLRVLATAGLVAAACPAAAQPPEASGEAPAPPAIRRWADVQHLHLSSRFRWVKASDGRLTSSTLQWQPQVRARFLVDRKGRHAVHVGAFGGSQFVSGWNNTGGGIGEFSGAFTVKQIFAAIQPGRGFELQAGSLYMLRGENTEITSYDTDAYIVGERVSWRAARGALAQVAVTAAYLGDLREPNAFRRLHRMAEWNYAQVLIGLRVGARTQFSADYTYEDGRDILREGATITLPAAAAPLRAVKVDAYQRLAPDRATGVNVAAELALHPRLGVTAGVTSIDRRYGPLNADRYEVGTRVYSAGTFALTRDLSIGWFHGEAFATPYRIPNRHRFEILVTLNPTATLRAKRVF